MARLFLRFGRLLVVSRRHKRIRGTIIFLFRNFFLLAAVILTAEIVITCLGLVDLYLPLPGKAWDILSRLVL